MQRQLTIEKGEDRYNHLKNKKQREYKAIIVSQFRKQMIQQEDQYFQVGPSTNDRRIQQNFQFAGRQWRADQLASSLEKTEVIRQKKQQQRVTGYSLGRKAADIAQHLVKLY